MNKPTKPVLDLGEDSKATSERGRYQQSKKPWLRREQSGGRSNNERNRSFHRDDSTSSNRTTGRNPNTAQKTTDNKELKEDPLN